MKSILISIKPEWVALILNGNKTIEIRKTIPKCEFPIKCYIYCTKAKTANRHLLKLNDEIDGTHFVIGYYGERIDGLVVAEFTLNRVEELENVVLPTIPTCVYLTKTKRFASALGCLSQNEIYNYLGGKNGYAWYIDNLKIYDKPKELCNFSVFIPNNKCEEDCARCNAYNKEYNTCLACMNLCKTLKRPPQSWCYVEEV